MQRRVVVFPIRYLHVLGSGLGYEVAGHVVLIWGDGQWQPLQPEEGLGVCYPCKGHRGCGSGWRFPPAFQSLVSAVWGI